MTSGPETKRDSKTIKGGGGAGSENIGIPREQTVYSYVTDDTRSVVGQKGGGRLSHCYVVNQFLSFTEGTHPSPTT